VVILLAAVVGGIYLIKKKGVVNMDRQNSYTISVFLVIILAISGMLCAQRVIDLDKVWGDMRVLGKNAEDFSGCALAYGDLNGDGYEDIIIGARWGGDIDCLDVRGYAQVIFGSSSPPSTYDMSSQWPDITVIGAGQDDNLGWAVASGDINGDGYDDLIVGSLYADPGDPARSWAGATYVILGKVFSSPTVIDLGTQNADVTVWGANAGSLSGCAVASGDVNNDGFDDLIIGAYAADPGDPVRTDAGETYVVFGSGSMPATVDLSTQANITLYGVGAGNFSGYRVASGNVNGDDYDDIIIGAYPANKTYVVFGSGTPPTTVELSTSADITASGDGESSFALAIGNVNGDGFDDLIIGEHYSDRSLPYMHDAGETHVAFGSSSPPSTIALNTEANITVKGESYNNLSGSAVASGDVNGDGYDDIIIGATEVRSAAGKTYVVFGFSPSSPVVVDLRSLSAPHIAIFGDSGRSGHALASGDINGDGYDDIAIGAPFASGMTGETYLIAGGGALITAHGRGGTSLINEFSLLGNSWNSFKAFGATNSQGEVHLAVADTDADGRDEIAAGQGEGGKSWVKLFEVNGSAISSFKAFGAVNTNGEVHLTIGNCDAVPADNEIAVAQGEGGKSWIKVFKTNGTSITNFKAFGIGNAQGEVHLAAGDLENADGIDEIIAGMGEGGSSVVKIFSYDGTLIRSFKAYGPIGNPSGEVHVAVGNFDADADLEIATATGYNGSNIVKLFDKDGTFISKFSVFVLGGNPNGDVHITTGDIDNDGIDEIICAHGEGGSSAVHVCKVDGTIVRSFKAFGGVNAQGEVHLGKSNY